MTREEIIKEVERLDKLMADYDNKGHWRAGDRVAQRIDRLQDEYKNSFCPKCGEKMIVVNKIKDNTQYNGWRNWATWCASLWFNNDEYLYQLMLGFDNSISLNF